MAWNTISKQYESNNHTIIHSLSYSDGNNQPTYFSVGLSVTNVYWNKDSSNWTVGASQEVVSGTGQSNKTLSPPPGLKTIAPGNSWLAIDSGTWTWSWNKDTSAKTVTVSLSPGGVSKSFTVPALASYTVSYNANGGSGAPGNQTKYYGRNLTLSSTVPSRPGYTFNGWNTNASGTGTNYAEGATYTGNAALTLYAKWIPNTYTVIYNANAPSGRTAFGSTPNSSHTYDAYKNLTQNGYTVPDYVFVGWATSSAGSISYTNGQSVKNLATSGTKTLYAVWRYAYTKAVIEKPTAVRYNGLVPDDTGSDARVFVGVTPGMIEDNSFQKSYIETRVYAQVKKLTDSSWPAITYETIDYQIVDDETERAMLEFVLSPPSGENEFETDTQYDVRVIAIIWANAENKAESMRQTFISKANFVIDINPDGTAIGILTAVGDDDVGLFVGKDMYLEIDTVSGTDPLYAAIVALGWEDDVIVWGG